MYLKMYVNNWILCTFYLILIEFQILTIDNIDKFFPIQFSPICVLILWSHEPISWLRVDTTGLIPNTTVKPIDCPEDSCTSPPPLPSAGSSEGVMREQQISWLREVDLLSSGATTICVFVVCFIKHSLMYVDFSVRWFRNPAMDVG